MQKDSNGDLHPCTYHSAIFSPAERNYNIYDKELLTVIQALKEWRHYLTGTEHPVTVITDIRTWDMSNNLKILVTDKLGGGYSYKNTTLDGG